MKRYARPVAIAMASVIVVVSAIRHRTEVVGAAAAVWRSGWSILPAFALSFLWNHVASCGWHGLVVAASGRRRAPSVRTLALSRLEAQALNAVLPAAGDVARAGHLHQRARISVVLDVLAGTVAGAAFVLVALFMHPRCRPARLETLALAFLGATAVGAAWAWLPALLGRLGSRFPALAAGRALEPAFRRAVALRLVEQLLGVAEIWLLAAGLGTPLLPAACFFVAGAQRVASAVGGFVPGQIGVAEGASMWALAALGQPPAAGLALALARRGRELLGIVAGGVAGIANRVGRKLAERSAQREGSRTVSSATIDRTM